MSALFILVLMETSFKVVCYSRIQRPVVALNDVHEIHTPNNTPFLEDSSGHNNFIVASLLKILVLAGPVGCILHPTVEPYYTRFKSQTVTRLGRYFAKSRML